MYLNMTLKSQMSICAAKPDLEEISSTPENAVLARSKEGTVQYVIIYTGYSMIWVEYEPNKLAFFSRKYQPVYFSN